MPGTRKVALEATLWGDGAWVNDMAWGGGGSFDPGAITLLGDPDFVGPDAGDYHIGRASAARDTGIDAGVTTDIDGDARPLGPAPDIGADEVWGWHLLPLVLRN